MTRHPQDDDEADRSSRSRKAAAHGVQRFVRMLYEPRQWLEHAPISCHGLEATTKAPNSNRPTNRSRRSRSEIPGVSGAQLIVRDLLTKQFRQGEPLFRHRMEVLGD
jgi:hypothetical protein